MGGIQKAPSAEYVAMCIEWLIKVTNILRKNWIFRNKYGDYVLFKM